METRLSIKYSGPQVDDGLMDVYQASANMIAFSEFMVAAVKSAYGQDSDAKANVAGFGKGSFITDLVFSVAGAMPTLLASLPKEHLIDVIKDAVALWKHLKGIPPRSVVNNGQNVAVENNSGQIINVKTDALNLVFSEKGALSAERFIKSAIEQVGIDGMQISSGDGPVASVSKNEASYFVPVEKESPVSENVVTMALILVAPVFQDGNKWRFSDGSTAFSAAIEDQGFIDRVNDGERFGKGDVLKVEMRISQTKSANKISVDRVIAKVLEHKEAAKQGNLI